MKEGISSATKLTGTTPITSASASSVASREMDRSVGEVEVTTGYSTWPNYTANTGSGSGNLSRIPHLTTNDQVGDLTRSPNEINVNNSNILKTQVAPHQRNQSLSGMQPVN